MPGFWGCLDERRPTARRSSRSPQRCCSIEQATTVVCASCLILVAIAVPVALIDRRLLRRTIGAAALMLIWVVRTCLEWRRLRQIDPYQYQ